MLKKLALILAVLFVLKLIPSNELIFNIEGDYTFYLDSASSKCNMLTVSFKDAKTTKNNLKNVRGESVKTADFEVVYQELDRLMAEFVFSERVDDIIINYYYSNKISAYKTINGKKINLQTANNSNYIIIGSPMIFGSF